MHARTHVAAISSAAVALVLTLAACSPTTPIVDDEAKAPAVVQTPDKPLETPPAKQSATPTPAGPSVQVWGQGITYADGLAVTIAQPTGFAPTEYAAGTEGFSSFVTFTITVTNGTSDAWDPSMFNVEGTSGGAPMSEVYDSGNAVAMGGAPSASILPGQSVTWPVAFGVANTADITLDVMPGYDPDFTAYADAFWQGAAA